MSHFTIVGSSGFIGSEIKRRLINTNVMVWTPARDELSEVFSRDLGTVIYCAGYGDCSNSPFDVLNANTTFLAEILEKASFKHLIYISSTRVYMGNISSHESTDLTVCSDDQRRLFNLTKLVSEELCLKSKRNVTILRPSNVYGIALNSPLFLPQITKDAILKKEINFYVSPMYAKDYVSVHDVANVCCFFAFNQDKSQIIYNVAAGYNTTAEEISDLLQAETGCNVIWHQMDRRDEIFPVTEINTLKLAYKDYMPRNVLSDIKFMVDDFKKNLL
ncbi:NAD(P)-dependent oxidoreductase [Limnobaculum zhutongyuii]|uniref:NAD(P)-dependent oxidoreductase n=1 Tax=Limnobaculum zhutongyuii TaxID=2498113 RepID=A0A411WNY9_9GAMM|nr:NAD(P)-dependent oxidoreductase [Limnobaculum zhutongyuii]QBH97931.1 NAD(P)-dependent oxidoreductase [Limnobaculum zhutongyuii]TQS88210.1 NAD(P)-dependent oxidoreductase [Limnobaculum zhutongyuii]